MKFRCFCFHTQRFIQETTAILQTPTTPEGESWNTSVQQTPGVIGAQEVYRYTHQFIVFFFLYYFLVCVFDIHVSRKYFATATVSTQNFDFLSSPTIFFFCQSMCQSMCQE